MLDLPNETLENIFEHVIDHRSLSIPQLCINKHIYNIIHSVIRYKIPYIGSFREEIFAAMRSNEYISRDLNRIMSSQNYIPEADIKIKGDAGYYKMTINVKRDNWEIGYIDKIYIFNDGETWIDGRVEGAHFTIEEYDDKCHYGANLSDNKCLKELRQTLENFIYEMEEYRDKNKKILLSLMKHRMTKYLRFTFRAD
jgi:hypothetical protein